MIPDERVNDTLPENQDGGEEMPVLQCPHCNRGSDFRVAAQTDDPNQGGLRLAIGFCLLCGKDAYLSLNASNNSVVRSYPRQGHAAPKELPETVNQAFTEALLCQDASAPNGAMLMARRAIQESLKLLGANANEDLPTQLQKLVDKQKITPELKEWADHARIGGRIAAHGTGGKDWGDASLEWEDSTDAEAVIASCLGFFAYIYVIPEQNRQRREQTGIPPALQSETDNNEPSPS